MDTEPGHISQAGINALEQMRYIRQAARPDGRHLDIYALRAFGRCADTIFFRSCLSARIDIVWERLKQDGLLGQTIFTQQWPLPKKIHGS
ncbi:MAG: hypothetical protein Q9191_008448, partial [Dirinaria sp. TL-2023a]